MLEKENGNPEQYQTIAFFPQYITDLIEWSETIRKRAPSIQRTFFLDPRLKEDPSGYLTITEKLKLVRAALTGTHQKKPVRVKQRGLVERTTLVEEIRKDVPEVQIVIVLPVDARLLVNVKLKQLTLQWLQDQVEVLIESIPSLKAVPQPDSLDSASQMDGVSVVLHVVYRISSLDGNTVRFARNGRKASESPVESVNRIRNEFDSILAQTIKMPQELRIDSFSPSIKMSVDASLQQIMVVPDKEIGSTSDYLPPTYVIKLFEGRATLQQIQGKVIPRK